MTEPDLKQFSCYCVDLSDDDLHRLMRRGEWRRLEVMGVGHVCTGCRADYRLFKSILKQRATDVPANDDN